MYLFNIGGRWERCVRNWSRSGPRWWADVLESKTWLWYYWLCCVQSAGRLAVEYRLWR